MKKFLKRYSEIAETLKVTCAWCGKDMGTKGGDTSKYKSHEKTSHSICKPCKDDMMSQIDGDKKKSKKDKK